MEKGGKSGVRVTLERMFFFGEFEDENPWSHAGCKKIKKEAK